MGENDREQEFYQIVLTKDELIYFKINTAEGFQTIPQNVVFLVKDRYIYKEMTQI